MVEVSRSLKGGLMPVKIRFPPVGQPAQCRADVEKYISEFLNVNGFLARLPIAPPMSTWRCFEISLSSVLCFTQPKP